MLLRTGHGLCQASAWSDVAKNTSQTCLHCRAPIPTSSSGQADPYCCNGCRAAHALITEAGLTRYYELSQGAGTPGDTTQTPMSWLEPLVTTARNISNDPRRIAVTVDVQGLHCAGCVWLLQALFRKKDGALHLDVNPGLGRLTATYDPERFDLAAYLADLAQLGYRAGPPLRDGQSASDGLGLRLGITFAIAMNAMAVSAAGYFGLEPNDPDGLFTIFGWVNLVLAVLAFSIGAPVFIRGAYQALKRRSFHLDLPIAIGLILAFSGSVALFFSGQPERAYFDTLDLFIALMLLGRWAQRRFLERNRRLLLEDDGFESARVKILEGEDAARAVPVSRPLSAIRAGTRLLISPGELVPVAARLESTTEAGADFSLAWITGESDPVAHAPGSAVVAGAHLLGKRATVIECLEPFASSSLHDLLRRPAQEDIDHSADEVDAARARRNTSFWHHVTTAYVAVVLIAALAALVAWLVRDPSRALDVTTAVLVVTCPCAIGLATPLAYELAINRLRRLGLHTRRHGLLDRAKNLRAVVFDKTGTLTLGELSLENPEAISGLTPHDRDALAQMVYRSNHPKSRALAVVVSPQSLSGEVEELVGVGLTMTDPTHPERQLALIAAADGRDLRFIERRANKVSPALSPDTSKSDASIVEYLEEREIARFTFREIIRADARAQVQELQRLGVEVHLASGDAEDRAAAIGHELGIDSTSVHARMKPEDKSALVTRLEQKLGPTLMIGDGVNDALAFDAATVAGTPAIDRPTLPARADFFLTTRGVGPIAELIAEARAVRHITTRNLVIAFGYNGIALTAALFGVLSPLVSAVAMPISSLLVLALTIGSQRASRACPVPLPQQTPNLEATA